MIKVGIFFGGPSREREIAFAGGRTVYDNLNKSIFEPIPIFIDSQRNFILLDWQYVYKGTIRDFYPSVEVLPPSPNVFQVYVESLGLLSSSELENVINKVGRKIDINELASLVDIAFLSLHGSYGEDGQIQGLLESLHIPYTGSGIRACTIGMDKAFQKKMMEGGGFPSPEILIIPKDNWEVDNFKNWYEQSVKKIGYPMVIRPANQGSSIGVAIIKESEGYPAFEKAVNAAFFRENINLKDWNSKTKEEKVAFVRYHTDIRDGLGFPVDVNTITVYHPEELLTVLDELAENSLDTITVKSHMSEQRVIIEGFIKGKEFSCIVLKKEDGSSIALPPTEIVKGGEVFDYRSKYLPGLSRKVTPIDLPQNQIQSICDECVRLFEYFEFNTYARIDGFINDEGTIFLNDPNTTSGMLPSSFFFHQAAEIGLNPSQFLTYILRISLQERLVTSTDKNHFKGLLQKMDDLILSLQKTGTHKKKVAVFLGGYSSERHISVESGRNIYEKLASSETYEPIPIFLTGNDEAHDLFQLPINLLLKDNADDIRDKIKYFKTHNIVEKIKDHCSDITEKYASKNVVFEPKAINYDELKETVDAVFIALHGRPGEDGNVQRRLAKMNIPFNGSPYESASITIDKYKTLQLLKKHDFSVTEQVLISEEEFQINPNQVFTKVENAMPYPLIAKPVDDGCSSAVKKIKNRDQLEAFFKAMFRKTELIDETLQTILQLKPKEEFPQKQFVLIEQLIDQKDADHFLEITGGLLTHFDDNHDIQYEIFEPSEALAGGEILSLEEKFLAGEGQNITPARFTKDKANYSKIAKQVKAEFKRAAQILNIEGYARIDAFVRIYGDKAETIIIEINSLPGMTPATCIFHQAAINKYKPYHFIEKILEFGMENRRVKQRQ